VTTTIGGFRAAESAQLRRNPLTSGKRLKQVGSFPTGEPPHLGRVDDDRRPIRSERPFGQGPGTTTRRPERRRTSRHVASDRRTWRYPGPENASVLGLSL